MNNFCKSLCCMCWKSKNNNIQINIDQEPLIPDGKIAPRIIEDYAPTISSDQNTEDKSIKAVLEDDSSYSEQCFNERWIRDEEKGLITYTKRSIIDILEKEFISNEGYEDLSNKDNMILSIKNTGTILTDQFPLIRLQYFLPKAELPSNLTLEDLGAYMSSSSKRKLWDNSIKDYELIEGEETNGVLHILLKRPAVMISERDIVEKIISFRANNGVYYSMSSSLNEDFIPRVDEVERIVDWISGYALSEDETNFYFKTITQMDFKMVTPQFILKFTLPTKMKEWYKEMKKKINEDFKPLEDIQPEEVKDEPSKETA